MSGKKLSGKLEKLVIYSFKDQNFQEPKIEGSVEPTFIAPINPENFTKNYKIEMDDRRAHGSNGTDVRYKSTVPEELKLDIILDGTGTMEGYWQDYKSKPVAEQLKIFLDCVYTFQGEIHRPNFLMIIWGTEINFRCILSNLDINYTLFNTDGSPIRAKLSATFLNYKAREESLAANRASSPDLTHHRRVKQGDRLDLMTYKIYNSASYFLQVANINGLSTVRKIKQGTDLYFPPFDKKES